MLRKLVAIAMACTVALAASACGYSSAEDLQEQIAKEIPVGTEKAEVVAFLDAHKFEHSGRFRPELYYDKDRTVSASAPHTRFGVLVSGKLYVTFKFDDADRLVSSRVEEVLTGL